jgi:hypothetical protein
MEKNKYLIRDKSVAKTVLGVRFRRGLDSDGGASFHKKLSFGFKEYPFTPWLAGRRADYSIVLC